MDINKAKATFCELKNTCINTIVNFFKKRNVSELPFKKWRFSNTPVIIKGLEDYDTYTLTNLVLADNGKALVGCSSCDDETCITANKLSFEVLIDFVEWLQDNEEKIDKYLAEENEE